MPEILVPVGTHLFSPSALQAALDKAIPQTQLEPGQHGAAVATVDADGLQVALIYTSKDTHWRIRGAYARDWAGDQKLAGDILYKF